MARFRMNLEYDGTNFSGWQVQKKDRTVQGEFFKAIKLLFETEKFEFLGASRTDAGVHALSQSAHLDVNTSMDAESIKNSLNTRLPSDISILDIIPVDRSFHAREHVKARSYIYQISKRKMAFGKRYVWWIKDKLDIELLKEASSFFKGMNDFSSFTIDKDTERSMQILIDNIQIKEIENIILIRIKGSHFLWRMVRQIVGVLVELGKGKITLEKVKSYLTTKSFEPRKFTAPPSGLFLEKVYYKNDKSPNELKPCLWQAIR